MRSAIKLTICLMVAAIAMVSSASATDEPAIVVGRVYHIEGELLRYIPQEKDWVAVVKDAPFGTEDTLFSGNRGMAELIVPNGTWIRIGNSTQIQFIALETDLAEIDVISGEARFYNKSSRTVIKVTSPFGYVLADPGTVFDFYVGDDSAEAVAVKGRVSFVHSATEAEYDVTAGSPSILADMQQVSSGDGTVNPDWNRWNTAREDFWAAKARVAGQSVEYLPSSLYDEAYALEENGRWERVHYEGTERWFWRPTTVVAGWSPFTVGRWTDWYGDQTWIPAEPFGYITHHYGNWLYARNYWYWAPPVVSVRVGLPLLNVGFYWSPGRVSWIHTGIYVGWVPLAPRETYYSHRHWGGAHTVVVNNVNINSININVKNYAYINRAIVVNRDNFYKVNNYRNVRVTNISGTTIINNYRAAPVVNNTVINNYTTNKQRYNYTNVKVNEKPHNTVINRIQQNRSLIREGRKENGSVVQERVKGIPEGRINREAWIDQPRVTNHIVPAREVNRPKSEIKLQEREIKKRGEGEAEISPWGIGRPGPPSERSGQPRPPAERPERLVPERSTQQQQPVQPERSAQRLERVAPVKPAQVDRPAPHERPAQRPERVAPERSAQQQQPIQPERPAQRLERVAPVKPAQVDKPVPPEQPAQRPERLTPAKPEQQEISVEPGQPVDRPDRKMSKRPERKP